MSPFSMGLLCGIFVGVIIGISLLILLIMASKEPPRKEDCFMITDGCSYWSKRCSECGRDSMEVVRPGKVQCGYCG